MRSFLALLLAIGVAYATPLSLNGKHIEIEGSQKILILPASGVQVVAFITSWCPPCSKTMKILQDAQGKYNISVAVVVVDEDENSAKNISSNFPSAKVVSAKKEALGEFGVDKRVPLVLVSDKSGVVVKRFEALPKRRIFLELIKRIDENRLENGTLPIEERIDLWKNSRYDK